MRLYNNFWDNFFMGIFAATVVALLSFLICIFCGKEVLIGYSLEQSNGHLSIEKHVDYSINSYIELDRSITINEAVNIVDSLNKTIYDKLQRTESR